MILQQLFRFSSIFRSALSVQLRRNIGFSAIAFNKAKELDPVQKLFLEKIRDYRTKSQPKVCQSVFDVGLQTDEHYKQLTKSPDLNPIENLGSDLKRAVHRKCPCNLPDFEDFFKGEWAKIPKARCAMLIGCYPKRLNADLKSSASIKYKDVHTYATTLKAGGPVDVGPEYEKELNDQTEKLVLSYGGGDMTKFPEFKFEEPKFEEVQK